MTSTRRLGLFALGHEAEKCSSCHERTGPGAGRDAAGRPGAELREQPGSSVGAKAGSPPGHRPRRESSGRSQSPGESARASRSRQ